MICLTCTIFFNVFCCHYRCHVYGGLENSLVVDTVLRLWMSWPSLVGFSFTAKCWGQAVMGSPYGNGVFCKEESEPEERMV